MGLTCVSTTEVMIVLQSLREEKEENLIVKCLVEVHLLIVR